MISFEHKIFREEGVNVLEIDILPSKLCNFDCIFCPVGRTEGRSDKQKSFGELADGLRELELLLNKYEADVVSLNSKGEALLNANVEEYIDFIKGRGRVVRLVSNGYLLGVDKYRLIASKCDEVFGEIKTVNEDDFQKAQRPLTGYTLSEYVNNMASFRQQYRGRFLFAVTLIAGYNDDEASVEKICAIIRAIVSDEVVVRRMEDERFKRKLGINDGDFERISKKILTSGLPGQEGSNRVLNNGNLADGKWLAERNGNCYRRCQRHRQT